MLFGGAEVHCWVSGSRFGMTGPGDAKVEEAVQKSEKGGARPWGGDLRQPYEILGRG